MSELIPIREHNGKQVVSARDLHFFLEAKTKFADWITSRIEKYDFIDGEDFVSFSESSEKGGRPTTEFALTLDTAKELAMVEGNEKGKQARRYFLECEKKVNQMPVAPAPQLPMNYEDALRELLDKTVANRLLLAEKSEAEAKLAEAQPKIEFFDTVTQSEDEWEMAKVAKVLNLGMGRNTIFKKLREKQILNSVNNPYQRFVNDGFFRMATTTWTDPVTGIPHVYAKTVVTQKGVDFIRRTIK